MLTVGVRYILIILSLSFVNRYGYGPLVAHVACLDSRVCRYILNGPENYIY